MAEVESTIETIPAEAETIHAEAAKIPDPAEPPKRGRGRPAGSKDLKPRATKPRVKVEPIPQPEPEQPAPKARKPVPRPVEERSGTSSQLPTPEDSPPVADQPEPPSPRTLFRQTSAQLLNLRDVMNSQKRASAAERYTSKMHNWPVV